MKSSTISTLGEDYINVAKARGLSERRILTAYVGRNSLLPVIPRIAINIGFVVGGSVIVERLFEYPGIGRALFTAVSTRDYMEPDPCRINHHCLRRLATLAVMVRPWSCIHSAIP